MTILLPTDNPSDRGSMTLRIPVKKLHPLATLPFRAHQHDAGADLHYLGVDPENLTPPILLEPGNRVLIDTGLAMLIPPGYEGQVRPRSGLAAKHGVTILNAPATIDAGYQGPWKVILINHGKAPVAFYPGDRIAQLVFAPFTSDVEFYLVDEFPDTERGTGGFGSSGT